MVKYTVKNIVVARASVVIVTAVPLFITTPPHSMAAKTLSGVFISIGAINGQLILEDNKIKISLVENYKLILERDYPQALQSPAKPKAMRRDSAGKKELYYESKSY